MLSDFTIKIHKLAKGIEQPILLKLKQQGGFAILYEKLNTPWFKSLEIDTVLDIGANIGQFTKTISLLLPAAQVYSFEPLPDCFEQLQTFTQNNPNITAFNLGIGDRSGAMSFERSSASVSSSFLKMTDIHKEAFPSTKDSQTVDVKIARLDDIAPELNLGKSLFIKIDVQGYEDKVLIGGEQTIKQAKIVIVETSFATLYESQPLFDDIYTVFRAWGFTYVGMIDQLLAPNTGKALQGDAVFIREGEIN